MRYFIAFLVTMGLIFLLVFLLFGGSSKPKVLPIHKTLHSYALTDAQVQLTIDGPINAVQNHQEVQITVDRNNVTYEQLQGYDGNVVNMQTYDNTENAYTVFLFALARAGFTQGSNDPTLSDERGFCPLGDRYIFQLMQDGNTIERYWATNCGSPKTYLGLLNVTLSLFQAQVPNYSKLTGDIPF